MTVAPSITAPQLPLGIEPSSYADLDFIVLPFDGEQRERITHLQIGNTIIPSRELGICRTFRHNSLQNLTIFGLNVQFDQHELETLPVRLLQTRP